MSNRYMYIRSKEDPRKVLTIGFYVELCNDKETIYFACATCNPIDNFSRKIGRTIVDGRLEGYKKYVTHPVEGESNRKTIIDFLNLDPESINYYSDISEFV